MNADALRAALSAAPDGDSDDDETEDTLTAAGQKLAKALDLNDEQVTALANFIAEVQGS